MEQKKPPKAYTTFVKRFPELGRAWSAIRDAEEKGPLDEDARRLIKLGIAMGAMREGAVHSNVRKALGQGISPEAIEQAVALAASTVGMPSAVALHCWVRDVLEPSDEE
jgi:alkylhydroperoxidase/carboxymuconolactone decarboxylase family protein YurZ